MRVERIKGWVLIVALVALAVVAAWKVEDLGGTSRRSLESRPKKMMGTSCRIIAVPGHATDARAAASEAGRALQQAESALRQVEAEMSSYIDASALSRLNAAPAHQPVPLPPAVLGMLKTSQDLHAQTRGAFDVTCRPLIELWRRAGELGRLPSDADIDRARRASSWASLELGEKTALKSSRTVRVDLGGIAKGHGIDRAVQVLREAGMAGGLVDVGGDLRAFGAPPQGQAWEVKIQDPMSSGTIVTLEIGDGAVCTSGGYHRYVTIGGRRYSHIIDPRTGQPAQAVASATVLAADATTADVWATALSVVGEKGLAWLPRNVEALLVVGTQEEPRSVLTPGMKKKIVAGPAYPVSDQKGDGAGRVAP